MKELKRSESGVRRYLLDAPTAISPPITITGPASGVLELYAGNGSPNPKLALTPVGVVGANDTYRLHVREGSDGWSWRMEFMGNTPVPDTGAVEELEFTARIQAKVAKLYGR